MSTLSEGEVGVLHGDKFIYKGLCEVPVVAASGLLPCELIMRFASECLQGCFEELLMYCSEMLESWEEQSASCDESVQGDRPPKNRNNKKTF